MRDGAGDYRVKAVICRGSARYKAIAILLAAALLLGCIGSVQADATGNTVGTDADGGGGQNATALKNPKNSDFKDRKKLQEIVEKAIQATGDTDGGSSSDLDLPVKGIVTSKVGIRHDPIDGSLRRHSGIDIAIPEGTPVTPIAAGKVLYSGQQHGYGNMVIVRHDDGMITIYAHHSRNCVKTGDRVNKSTRIAYSGSTGRSTGPHLHFEAWQNGRNVTEAFLPSFAGHRISEGSDASLEKTNLRKVIMSDGTILFIEVSRPKSGAASRGRGL